MCVRLATDSHRLAPLFTVAYGLGLRRGEILGLRWSDVDFDKRVIHVRHTMQRLGAGTGRVFRAAQDAAVAPHRPHARDGRYGS